MEFKNKTVIITGAASGMGKLSCERFAKEGANIVMLDVNEEALKKQENELKDKGFNALGIVCNVRNYYEIENAVKTAKETYGTVDVTISYAGGFPGRIFNEAVPFGKRSIESLDWGVDVNFKAPLYMARAVVDIMKEQKSGVIINIGSIDGVTGSATVDYSSEKAGLIGLTKSIALYGADSNVRCCMVSPGPVMTRPGMANMRTPLGRAAEPIEVVDLVMYLASGKAAFISGDNYLVDGARACAAGIY